MDTRAVFEVSPCNLSVCRFVSLSMSKTTTIPVSKEALAKRIDRTLNKQGLRLRKSRNKRARQELGEFYAVSIELGGAWPTHIDLEDYGRELGVLQPGERLVEE